MKPILIRPVEIIGTCPAGLTPVAEWQLDGMNLHSSAGSPLCFLALSQIPIMVWQLQSDRRFFSHATCPGCTADPEHENRIVFLLAHADRWALSRMISDYLRLAKKHGVPPAAQRSNELAIERQNTGDFVGAERAMTRALAALREAAGDYSNSD